jgi:DNA polymerase III delta prime subunit
LFAPSVLSSAASGHRLPTLPVTLAFVASCGGDRANWERRWRKAAANAGAAEFRKEWTPAVPRPPVQSPAGRGLTAGQLRAAQPAMPVLTRPAQLPIRPGTFVGRRQALASASRVIGLTGRVRIPLLICGPIGVGKTAFALRLADDLSAEFPDGQLYADLSGCGPDGPSPDGIMRGFLQALGVPVPADQIQRTGLYRSLLAQRRLFVLLENASDEGLIRPLLGQAPHSQFVVTSSTRLLGLDGMHRIDLGTFARQESMTLISRLVGAQRFQAEQAAAHAVAELCGDLPLAVNIIGRKMAARPEWTIAYAARLLADRDRVMDSLSVGDVNVRDRLASAYRLLPPGCRTAIRQLGLSGASWATASTLAAALGISAHSADEQLESLVDAGLLTRADTAGRYYIPTLVSVFAAGAKPDAGQLAIRMPGAAMRDQAITA